MSMDLLNEKNSNSKPTSVENGRTTVTSGSKAESQYLHPALRSGSLQKNGFLFSGSDSYVGTLNNYVDKSENTILNPKSDYAPITDKTGVFGHKNFIGNEHWSSIVNIQARVLAFSSEIVTCECLIDSEPLLFENRDFPVILFKHLPLEILPYVLISIKTNIGSLKIDIYNGNDFVNKSLFEDDNVNDETWAEIVDSNFIKPFAYNPK